MKSKTKIRKAIKILREAAEQQHQQRVEALLREILILEIGLDCIDLVERG